MAEDLDVEAMLEAPYNKSDITSSSKHRSDKYSDKHKDKDRDGGRRSSRSKDRRRSRDRDLLRSRDRDDKKDRGERDRDRDKDRKDRDRDREKERDKDKDRNHRDRERDRGDKDRDRGIKDRDRGDKDRDRGDKDRDRGDKDRDRGDKDRDRGDKDRDRGDKDRDRVDKDRDRVDKDRDRVDKDRDRVDKDRDRGDKERDRGDKERDRGDKDRDRGDKDRDRGDKDRERDRVEKERERDKDKRRSKDKERSRERERSRPPRQEKTDDQESIKEPYRSKSRGLEGKLEDLPPEERDLRTVFCMQLSQRIRAKDLEEFFSSVGKVRDVRLITCNKTRRFKGIAYIEFKDAESVPLALGLTGQKLLGVPIIVQHTQAEKNRVGNTLPNLAPKASNGPTRLYVGSLHFNITEDMLRGIFEPFGKIDQIQLMTDPDTAKSKGYGFLTFHHAADAKKAMDQLNGFELAGRPMKVGNVTERTDGGSSSRFDADELDRAGVDLGATGRLQLMFKLAEGTGLQIPPAAASVLMGSGSTVVPPQPQVAPPIATQCFMLNNMFDPISESNPSWDIEIRDDVISECNKHGGVLHVYVDKASPQGNVYCKCPTIATAVASVNSLHGRWFAGRVITAAYVPLVNYHSLFPDAMTALTLLLPTRQR